MPSFLFGYSEQEVLKAQWDIITTFENCLSHPNYHIYVSLGIPRNHRSPLETAESLGKWFGANLIVFKQLAECREDLKKQIDESNWWRTSYYKLLGEPFQKEYGEKLCELKDLKEKYQHLDQSYYALKQLKEENSLIFEGALHNARNKHSQEVDRLKNEISGLYKLVARQQEELLRLRPTDKPRTKAAHKPEGDTP